MSYYIPECTICNLRPVELIEERKVFGKPEFTKYCNICTEHLKILEDKYYHWP